MKSRISKAFVVFLVFIQFFGKSYTQGVKKMLESRVDDPSKDWCYLQKSTTVIGFPYQPDVVQVTYDGALYTGNAELCFFYGNPLRPLLARQKKWKEGWMPVVEYDWKEKSLTYHMEMFSARVEGASPDNPLQFVKITVVNAGKIKARGYLTAAARISAGDYRFGGRPSPKDLGYEIKDNLVIRDGALIYAFPEGAYTEAVPGKKYGAPFHTGEYGIDAATETCVANYSPWIEPGRKVEFIFKMPRVPVPLADTAEIDEIRSAPYAKSFLKTTAFWTAYIDNGHTLDIPEKKVDKALKASLVHLALATRKRNGRTFMTDGLPYSELFLSSFVQHQQAFDYFGHPGDTQSSLDAILKLQMDDGLFYDESVAHGVKMAVAHGQTMALLCSHYFLYRDSSYAARIYPAVQHGVKWLIDSISADPYFLMPPVWPYDAEMILGHYTSHNLWALYGLRSAIHLARDLGHVKDVEDWTFFQNRYRDSLLKAIRVTFAKRGYIPPGLYDYITGQKARAGIDEWQSNQEWENMQLLYPCELLKPDDVIADATLDTIRKKRYREGVMSYRIYLHQYITANMIEEELARNHQEQSLIDFYNIMVHLGPTFEGFENLVKPWEDRRVDPDCPPPHAWASAKLALLIRSMLILERGGEAGMNESGRALYLFSLLSPDWCKEGNTINLNRAISEFGETTASLKFEQDGASMIIFNKFHHVPAKIVIPLPFYVSLKKFKTDAGSAVVKDDCLVLSPDVHTVRFTWTLRKDRMNGAFQKLLSQYRAESTLDVVDNREQITAGKSFLTKEEEGLHRKEPLSFELVKKAFKWEYDRRAILFKAGGGVFETVSAPDERFK